VKKYERKEEDTVGKEVVEKGGRKVKK